MCCCAQGPAVADKATCTESWSSRCLEMAACDQANAGRLDECLGGDATACAMVDEHWVVLDEEGYRGYITAAAAVFEKGCGQGVGYACVYLGDLRGGHPSSPTPPPGRDPSTAIESWRKSCDADNEQGCERMWMAYQYGYGVAADPERASEYRERACSAGSDPACDPPGDH